MTGKSLYGDKNPAYVHGHAKRNAFSPEYHSWASMIQRCTNKKRTYFEYYGGRGISVCARWFEFSAFLEDMGRRPVGTSLDRINADGNYEPNNCRWATRKEQSVNRRQGKWAKAKTTIAAFVAGGINTVKELHTALAEHGIVVHEETVRELTRVLEKEKILIISRAKVNGRLTNVFKSVDDNGTADY